MFTASLLVAVKCGMRGQHVQFHVIHHNHLFYSISFFFNKKMMATTLNYFPTYHFTDEETNVQRLRHLPKAAGLRGDTNHTECSER